MTAVRIDLDAALRARTRRAMAVSVVAHTLLLAWLVLDHRDSPADPPLTEIVLLDPSTSGSPIAVDRKSTRLNSSHLTQSRMPSSA